MSVDDRLNAAADKAEAASEILHEVANGPVGGYVTTESGAVPTIPEWYALNQAALGGVPDLQTAIDDLQNPSDLAKGAFGVARALVQVESIVELLSAKRDPSVLVQVKGYHSGTRRGGGRPRYWDPTLSKANHNGGTIIDPDKVFPSDWSVLFDVQVWFTPPASGTGCWVMLGTGGVFHVDDFGAIANNSAINNQPMYDKAAVVGGAGATVEFGSGIYRMHLFFGYNDQRVKGNKTRIDLFKLSPTTGPTVLAGSGSNASYEDLWLNCLETNLPNVRTTFEDRSNATWTRCRFEGFRDAAPIETNNGWGVYLKRASNITFDFCQFENNSQNDVAILEGCTNINLISPFGSALNINCEPNSETPRIRSVTISNAKIKKLFTQENAAVAISTNCVVLENCDVEQHYFDGAGVRYNGGRVQSLLDWYDGLGRAFAGPLQLNGACGLGPNLLRDPSLGSVSYNLPGSSWSLFTGTIAAGSLMSRVRTTQGRMLVINPTNISGTGSLRSESVNVTAGQRYAVMALAGATRIAGGPIATNAAVAWYDSGGALLSSTLIFFSRGPAGATITPTVQTAIVVAPVGAVTAAVVIGGTTGSASTASASFGYVGLHQVIGAAGGDGAGYQDPYPQYRATFGNIVGKGVMPAAASNLNYEVGDKVEYATPVAGGYEGSICTVAGTPGTHKGYGLIQA